MVLYSRFIALAALSLLLLLAVYPDAGLLFADDLSMEEVSEVTDDKNQWEESGCSLSRQWIQPDDAGTTESLPLPPFSRINNGSHCIPDIRGSPR
jgi:hypothetical protein